MSNIYILSNELCEFCNVPHGSKMHIKQLVRIIEDYILEHQFGNLKQLQPKCFINSWNNEHPFIELINKSSYSRLTDYFNNKVKLMYIDEKLKKIFENIPEDAYIIKIVNELAKKESYWKRFTHNFNDIDMYLEMSGHLTPVLKTETHKLLNEISNKIDNVKSLVSYNDDAGNHLEEVNKLLKELEDMYHDK